MLRHRIALLAVLVVAALSAAGYGAYNAVVAPAHGTLPCLHYCGHIDAGEEWCGRDHDGDHVYTYPTDWECLQVSSGLWEDHHWFAQ